MSRTYPHIPFERYADDAICHCKSAEEARGLWSALHDRFAACKLVLHPEKTKIVYCKDANRRDDFPNQSFDFLGFTFRARKALGRGRQSFACFLPAASPKALTSISRTVRRWALQLALRLGLCQRAGRGEGMVLRLTNGMLFLIRVNWPPHHPEGREFGTARMPGRQG
jgi:hypothetical protein